MRREYLKKTYSFLFPTGNYFEALSGNDMLPISVSFTIGVNSAFINNPQCTWKHHIYYLFSIHFHQEYFSLKQTWRQYSKADKDQQTPTKNNYLLWFVTLDKFLTVSCYFPFSWHQTNLLSLWILFKYIHDNSSTLFITYRAAIYT